MKVELLAPAGSLEKMKYAYLYGADAIYCGGREFSLRANAKNFSREELKEAVEYAHSLGKKVYVTVNIIFHNEDLTDLEDYLKYLESINVDAILASDVAVMNLLKDKNIKVPLHVSTQASTLNAEAALFYKNEFNAERIVLAREASKEDIEAIYEATGLEIECFAHGAMCTSLSGRCVMSNYATNRDSNRGGCAQVCRWTFDYVKEDKKLTDEPFSMTPKDLNMVPFIKDMIDSHVFSFKIEGRMRSIYYVSTVILIYRRIIDKILNNTLTDEYMQYATNILNRVANRDSTPQFFDKLPGVDEQYYLGREEVSNQDFLGLVLEQKDDLVKLEQRNLFKKGDVVQFFGSDTNTFDYTINEIYDEDMNLIDVARHPQMTVYIKVDKKVNKDDMMRIKTFDICE